MKGMQTSLALALCVALAAPVARLAAVERRPLPALTFAALDGQAVESRQIVRPQTWLLLYVQPDCQPCEELLRAVDLKAEPALADRTTIVVGAVDPAGLAKMIEAHPDLAGVSWVADPDRTMAAALGFGGAPVALGLKSQMIEWSLSGVLTASADVRSILTSWMRR